MVIVNAKKTFKPEPAITDGFKVFFLGLVVRQENLWKK